MDLLHVISKVFNSRTVAQQHDHNFLFVVSAFLVHLCLRLLVLKLLDYTVLVLHLPIKLFSVIYLPFLSSYNCSPCTWVQPVPTLFWLLSPDVSTVSLVLPVVIYWAFSFAHVLMLCSNFICPSCNLHTFVWLYVTSLNIAAVIYFCQAQSVLVMCGLECIHRFL